MKRRLFALIAVLSAVCSPARAQSFPFDGCGTMVQGVTCSPLFQDSQNLKWKLNNNGGFVVGDVVHVIGTANPICASVCQQGGCMTVASITTCITTIGVPFCLGDGSGMPCPCANNTPVGQNVGCLHSSALGGKLRASGVASISADTAVLDGSDMPNGPALYFQGDAQQTGGAGIPFGDGLLCIGGALVRLGVKFNAGGASAWPSGSDPLLSVAGGVVAGDVRHYQAWYRDAATYCASPTFNLTNGHTLTWGS